MAKTSLAVVESVNPKLCNYHRAQNDEKHPLENCTAGSCSVMSNFAESEAMLDAIQEISGDLIEALLGGATSTYAGSPLGSALVIHRLAVSLRSDQINPKWVRREADAEVGS